MLRLKRLLCLFLIIGFSQVQSAPYDLNTQNTQSPLATNVAPFNSWTPGWVLVDAFPKTQNWMNEPCDFASWGNLPPLDLDANRGVRSLADNQCIYISVYTDQAGHYPAGT